MKPKRFKKPPIKEAIIEIKVKPLNISFLDSLEQIKGIKKLFPNKKTIYSGSFKFKIDKLKNPLVQEPISSIHGYRYETKIGDKVVQYKLDGMAFSLINNYKSWELFIAQAQDLWKEYIGCVKPELVTRISCRFINRIPIATDLDFSKYFNFNLNNPKIKNFKVSGFLNRLQLYEPEKNIKILSTKMNGEITQQSEIPIILDNDILKDVQIDINSKEIWAILDSFREIKNQMFFKSIKNQTEELFI